MPGKLKDTLTIPNALTASRLAASPHVAKKLHDDPKGWWLRAGLFAMSDIADGFLARSGDKNPFLHKLGFKTSEIGRKLDPITDKIVMSELLAAGMRNETIPKTLGFAALAQKVAASGVGVVADRAGAEVHVTTLGKRSEFATNLGFGTLFIAESIDSPTIKQGVRAAGMAVAALGIAGATAATVEYVSQATQQSPEKQ